VLLSKKVDGLLLIAASQPSEQLRILVDAGPPVIVVDRELDDLPLSHVMVANHEGGRLAGEHLLGLGHRMVGVIAGPGELGTSARRLEGFRAALAEGGVAVPPVCVQRGDFRAAGGARAMAALLATRPRPSAVFAENDLMALGAVAAAHAAGLEVPDDLSVVGFDGIEFGEAVTPPLTTVVQSTEAIAKAAVGLLLHQLGDQATSPETLELPVSLAVRGSTGPAAGWHAPPTAAEAAPRAGVEPVP